MILNSWYFPSVGNQPWTTLPHFGRHSLAVLFLLLVAPVVTSTAVNNVYFLLLTLASCSMCVDLIHLQFAFAIFQWEFLLVIWVFPCYAISFRKCESPRFVSMATWYCFSFHWREGVRTWHPQSMSIYCAWLVWTKGCWKGLRPKVSLWYSLLFPAAHSPPRQILLLDFTSKCLLGVRGIELKAH